VAVYLMYRSASSFSYIIPDAVKPFKSMRLFT